MRCFGLAHFTMGKGDLFECRRIPAPGTTLNGLPNRGTIDPINNSADSRDHTMKVFVLNNGSSSAKFQLIDTNDEQVLAKGIVEKIGDKSVQKLSLGERAIKGPCEAPNHRAAILLILQNLMDPEQGVIRSLDEIGGIGHRVVHGGEKFSRAQVITSEVIQGIRDCSQFAPLHNPHNLKGIEICEEEMPGKRQVAVFDTAFHSKMPKEAFLYALPLSIYERFRIRR
jgi:acetate kinase